MKIWVNDGDSPKPEDDFFYELAANGLYLHKKMPFWDAVVPVEKISALEKREATLELKLPRIPEEIVKEVIRFFAWIYKKYRSEVAALIWYNKTENKYRITIPAQEVAFSSIKYDLGGEFHESGKDGYCLVGTIHSHSSMSAFHSCVDKKDEESFDGIHFTFGNFSDYKEERELSISSEAAINGTRFKLSPTDYLGGLESNEIKSDAFGSPEKKAKFLEKWWYVSDFGCGNKFRLTGGELILPEDYKPREDWECKVKKESSSWFPRGSSYPSTVGFATKRDDQSPSSTTHIPSPSDIDSDMIEAWGDDLIILDSQPEKIHLDKAEREDKGGKKKKDKNKKDKKN